jgi:hypothetical protein
MELTGKVVKILDLETISEKFKKQVVVIEQTDAMYDKEVPVEFVNKSVDEISSQLEVGQNVKLGINLCGREWQGRYFVNIRGWRMFNDEISEDSVADPVGASNAGGSDLPF